MHMACVGAHVYVSVCACGGPSLTSEVFFSHSLSYLLKQYHSLNPEPADNGSTASQLTPGHLQHTGVTGRDYACPAFPQTLWI